MLARTPTTLVYLSAEALSITERERAGLIEVRDDLASGRVNHAPKWDLLKEHESERGHDVEHGMFSMNFWGQKFGECGTLHCIGGFMFFRGSFERGMYSASLNYLFYPVNCGCDWYDFTVGQAVRAIDHFLSGAGADCWPMALADLPAA